jgi:hypothetical protein
MVGSISDAKNAAAKGVLSELLGNLNVPFNSVGVYFVPIGCFELYASTSIAIMPVLALALRGEPPAR